MNSSDSLTILGIESSCDDTSAAILRGTKILANVTASQKIHAGYGGVVPELASRAHQQNIIPVVDAALKKAGIDKSAIDAVGYTRGPGLLGPLLVGTSFAKSFAAALDIPLIPVHHMHAHVLAHFIENEGEAAPPEFPFICLTVSGGHTQLVLVKSPTDLSIVGETLDDAAGEAFDKAAKILGLGYPGGPQIDKLAALGDENRFSFSRPVVPEWNYSFSGLKTNFLYFLQSEVKKDSNFLDKHLADVCASYQKTIIDILIKKLINCAKTLQIKTIALAGGVSANSGLRARLIQEGAKRGWQVYIPPFEYCTDNGAMIAMAARMQYLNHQTGSLADTARARLEF